MIIDLHPNYIEKKGKKEFVILSYDEFRKIEEKLEDYEDLLDLRIAKNKQRKTKSKTLAEVKKELSL